MTSIALPGFFSGVDVSSDDAAFKFTSQSHSGMLFSYERFSTDVVGTHMLTLNNVVLGSRINISDQAGTTTLYDQIVSAPSVVIPIAVYTVGSPLNDWRIKVRKASGSPNYIPYETLMTAAVGSSSIYVSQIPDE